MKTLIVYDTQFGNTERVARAIAAAFQEHGSVQVGAVNDAGSLDLAGVDLLVVGGPTQQHGLSPTLRAWLDRFARNSLQGLAAAAFDTRVPQPRWLTGAASGAIAHQLHRAGCEL